MSLLIRGGVPRLWFWLNGGAVKKKGNKLSLKAIGIYRNVS